MVLFVIAFSVICHGFAGISLTLIITFVLGSKFLCCALLPQWLWADFEPLKS
jgi:hypothetical protein